MAESEIPSVTIEGPDSLGSSVDFRAIKRLGLDQIVESGSEKWTDHNFHDPGITILETLAYALTDVGYRASFPIEDILTERLDPKSNKEVGFHAKQFYTARQILTTAPVTFDDFRKSIIDIPGIQNAWVRPLDTPSNFTKGLLEIIVDPTAETASDLEAARRIKVQLPSAQLTKLEKALTLLKPKQEGEKPTVSEDLANLLAVIWGIGTDCRVDLQLLLQSVLNIFPEWADALIESLECLFTSNEKLGSTEEDKRASILNGIRYLFFNNQFDDDDWIPIVIREILEGIIDSECTRQSLLATVISTYYENRNLCQDLGKVTIRTPYEIAFNFQIRLDSTADPEKAYSKILCTLNTVLTNPVKFVTMVEMTDLAAGDIGDVFDGPPLQHGFIPDDELNPIVQILRANELSREIRDVEGVLQVSDLKICLVIDETPPAPGDWKTELRLPIHSRPTLASFKYNQYSTRLNLPQLEFHFRTETRRLGSYKLAPQDRDLPIPSGVYREITHYTSVQGDFPRAYNLQPFGPPPAASETRRAQIKQLQAYLLFFDQILANYLAQLANLGSLFSWDPKITQTRFFEGVESAVDSIAALIVGFPLGSDAATSNDAFDIAVAEYRKKLGSFRESPEVYTTRRNEFLDHLLGRFDRDLTGFCDALYDTELDGGVGALDTKLATLEALPSLGGKRSVGSNAYASGSPEHAGLQNWIESLFSIQPETKELADFNRLFFEGTIGTHDPRKALNPTYTIKTHDGSRIDLKQLMQVGIVDANYQLDANLESINGDEAKAWSQFNLDLIALNPVSKKVDFPSSGESLFVVIDFGRVLFFRAFDSQGVMVIDTDQTRLAVKEEDMINYRKSLRKYWGEETIPPSESEKIIVDALELIGSTHALKIFGKLPNSDPSQTYRFVRSFANRTEAEAAIEEAAALIRKFNRGSERVYLIEHTLLRPNIEKPLFGIELLNVEGEPWMKSARYLSQPILDQIKPVETLLEFYYEVDNQGKKSMKCVSCQPPYQIAEATDESGANPVLYRFEISAAGDSHSSMSVNINLVFGKEENQVKLYSTSSLETDNEAEALIDSWVQRVAKGAPSELLWRGIQKSYELTLDAEMKIEIPKYLAQDPYSHIITAVIPDWPTRFQSPKIIELLEQTIRQEAPAHLMVNIVWLGISDFQEFLPIYESWWNLYCDPDRSEKDPNYYSDTLLKFLLMHSNFDSN